MHTATPISANPKVVAAHERRQSTRLTEDYVPDSYDDMFSYYYLYVVKLVQGFGITPGNAEDVAMSILETFFEKDVLSDYDPTRMNQAPNGQRKAVFRTFLSGFVSLYVRHYREKQMKQAVREGVSIDATAASTRLGKEGEDVNPFFDVIDPHVDRYDLPEFDIVRLTRERLLTVKPVNALDRCNLPALFESVLRHTASEEGKVNVAALAAEYSVSTTSIQNWMKRLRVEVAAVMEVQ